MHDMSILAPMLGYSMHGYNGSFEPRAQRAPSPRQMQKNGRRILPLKANAKNAKEKDE